jgi:hypothetical protein
MIAHPPAEQRVALVAERQGQLVGWVSAYLNTNASASDVRGRSRCPRTPGSSAPRRRERAGGRVEAKSVVY